MIAKRWLRLPPSTARPLIWHTPRLVPTIAFSRSCTANALPVRIASTHPSRTRARERDLAPGVDDGGAGHHDDALPRRPHALHLLRRGPDHDALVDLGGDVVRHEAEDRVVAAALERPHADAGAAQRHRLALLHLALLDAARGRRRAARGRSPSSGPAPPPSGRRCARGSRSSSRSRTRRAGSRPPPRGRRRSRRPRWSRRGSARPRGSGRARAGPAPGSRSARRRARRCVRPTRNSWTSNSPPSSTTRSKTRRMMSESMRWPSRVIVSWTMVPSGLRGGAG